MADVMDLLGDDIFDDPPKKAANGSDDETF